MISFGIVLTKCLNKLKGFRRYYVRIHSPAGRDLVREFVDECNAQGVVPFFYHTLFDWYNKDFDSDFPKYLAYLRKSVELIFFDKNLQKSALLLDKAFVKITLLVGNKRRKKGVKPKKN